MQSSGSHTTAPGIPIATPTAPIGVSGWLPWDRLVERIFDSAAFAVLVAVAILAVATFKDYGLGWDDYTHAEYGGLLLRLYASGFSDQRALSFVNLYNYGGGFDLLAALVAKALPFDLFETRRLCGALVGLVGLAATWRIGRRIGGPLAGLLAVALLATCSLYYGHIFINAKDAPFAVAMAVLLLGLVRAFQEYPAPSPATVAICGIGLGLAFGTRVLAALAAIYILPPVMLIVAADARVASARQALDRAGSFISCLLPSLVLAYAVMALVWPWSVVAPLNPLRAIAYFSSFFEKPWKELFSGVPLPVPDMPRAYVPQLFALQTPEILLLLGIGGMAASLVASTRRHIPVQWRACVLLIALASLVPILLTVLTRPAMYNGIRHFVFIVPPFAALGGIAGASIIARLAALSRSAAVLAAGGIAAALLVPVADMTRIHPYEYTHFNRVAGGVRMAADRYMLDYWGLAFRQAAQELRADLAERHERPSAHQAWRVAVCGPQRAAQVELGPEFETSWDPAGADFAMTLGEFYCAKLDAPILLNIVRDGVVYARVYDIRGRSIASLLALPAP